MADDDGDDVASEKEPKASAFPTIPGARWWALRERFKQKIPSVVSPQYVASALGMSEDSARGNILRSLRAFGIIGEGDKPTPLATRWRDDTEYPQVCKEIREKAYPQSLLDVAPDPLKDKEAVRRWFAGHGVGASLVSKASAIYFLLWEADPAKANEPTKRERENGNGAPRAKAQPRFRERDNDNGGDVGQVKDRAPAAAVKQFAPQLHLNIQIHISPETTPEQIEGIFAAMGKHLKHMSE